MARNDTWLPPIRYPLPTMVLLAVVGLLAWRGERMSRPLRSALRARWAKALEGPPIPSSSRPQVVAGPVIRRALLLNDGVEASASPGGPPAESFRLRMFVEVYDTWPLQGVARFYRVGNRRPVGWVRSRDVLPWDTRLVVRPVEKGPRPSGHPAPSLPVLSWSEAALEVASWEDAAPWRELAGRGPIRFTDLRPESWGVWLSREEVLVLLRRTLAPHPAESPSISRLRAILGRLADDRPLGEDDLKAARKFLPAPIFETGPSTREEAGERLARANEQWNPEASWSGLSFAFVPLSDLPR